MIVRYENADYHWITKLIEQTSCSLLAGGGTQLTVGVLVAENGQAGYLGKVVRAGMEKAVQDIETLCSKEGCLRINPVYQDTQSSAQTAVQQFTSMYNQGTRIFTGMVTSEEAKAVAEYASQHATDALLVSPTSTAPELCDYKEQLYRLSMDDRGQVEAFFDVIVEQRDAEGRQEKIVPLVRDDIYGNGLVNHLSSKADSENSGVTVLAPIKYDPATITDVESARPYILSLLNSQSSHPNAKILLVAYDEAQFLLQAAASYPALAGAYWFVSDAIVFSAIRIPNTITVRGLTYSGQKVTGQHNRKEVISLFDYLQRQGLPPMPQAILAYDSISLIHDTYQNLQDHSVGHSSMSSFGLSGVLDLSACKDRALGGYSYALHLSENDRRSELFSVFTQSSWYLLSYYRVTRPEPVAYLSAADSLSRLLDDFSMGQTWMQEAVNIDQNIPVQVSEDSAPVVLVRKVDLLPLLSAVGSNCSDIQVTIKGRDQVTYKWVEKTYDFDNFPEELTIPAGNGWILDASCRETPTQALSTDNKIIQAAGGTYSFTLVCGGGAESGGNNLACIKRMSASSQGGRIQGDSTQTCEIPVVGGGCSSTASGSGSGDCNLQFTSPTLGSGSCSTSAQGGGKYICTELYRQGYLSPEIMMGDMVFGRTFRPNHPFIGKGYDILAIPLVSVMQSSETITEIVKFFAIPWAEEMAYNQGILEEGSRFGSWVMMIGGGLCSLVGGTYYAILSTTFVTTCIFALGAACVYLSYAVSKKKLD